MQRFILLAAALLTPVVVWAHAGHSDDPIKARRAYFTLIGANMGALGEMAKGKHEYSADAAQLHADNLAALAAYQANVHFPDGTSNKDHPGKTRARREIWDGSGALSGKFSDAWEDFAETVDALVEAADKGRAEMAGALSDIGATCKGCHDDFRAKDF